MESFGLFVASLCLRIGSFNPEVNFGAIALTELLMGIGIELFSMPILTILLSDLESPEIAEGSGSATFMRTVGASFAVSIVTYLWTRGGAVNHANLAKFVNPFNAGLRQSVAASGGTLQLHAAGINRMITQQGMQISFNHSFDALALFFCLDRRRLVVQATPHPKPWYSLTGHGGTLQAIQSAARFHHGRRLARAWPAWGLGPSEEAR